MNSEREIIKKLFESRYYEDLDEASFTANGSTYTCAFGHYSKDGESISREEYFKAKGEFSKEDELSLPSNYDKEDYDQRTAILLDRLNKFTSSLKYDIEKPDEKYVNHDERSFDDTDSCTEYLVNELGYDNDAAYETSKVIEAYSGDNEQPEGADKDLLETYLDELPVFYNGEPQYRGMNIPISRPDLVNSILDLKEGDVLKLRGFTSFSSTPRVAVDFVNTDSDAYSVMIVNTRNLTGKSLRNVSYYPAEDEVLYKPDAKLFVKNKIVIDKVVYLHVEEGYLTEDNDINIVDIGLEGTQHKEGM